MAASYLLSSLMLVSSLALGTGCSGDEAGQSDAAGAITFSDFRVTGLAATRADIQFDTSVPTDCLIEFGTSMMLGSEAVDPDMEEGERASAHDVPLEDLAPGTLYYYRARATDASGDTAVSEIQSFETLSAVDPTEGKTNYALLSEGTSVTEVSSNFGNGSNDAAWGIHNALDGSMSSEWSSNFDGDDAFVVLDFGKSRTISTFAFRSRKMNDGSSITKKLELQVGQEVYGPFDTDNPDQRYIFELPAPIVTQTLRVQYLESTGGNTGAKEIQFYGSD